LIQSSIQLLKYAVKSSLVSPQDVGLGDAIVITGATDDTTGIVRTLIFGEGTTSIELTTASGTKILKVSNNNFIHIIKKAGMLNLRKHNDYERDLEDMTKEDHQNKGRPEYGPEEKCEKSNLPTSKVSLSLRSIKTGATYYYVADQGFESYDAAKDYCVRHGYPFSAIQEEVEAEKI
jgi:hypothetical protein